jgi:hypothetical protein
MRKLFGFAYRIEWSYSWLEGDFPNAKCIFLIDFYKHKLAYRGYTLAFHIGSRYLSFDFYPSFAEWSKWNVANQIKREANRARMRERHAKWHREKYPEEYEDEKK